MSNIDDDESNDYKTQHARTSPRYNDEDTSPTTDRELKGWYAYPIAAEVFAVVAVGEVFRPIDFFGTS